MNTTQTKTPIALVKQGSDKIIAFACGKCGFVAGSPHAFVGEPHEREEWARDAAANHCGPWLCACGTEKRQHSGTCDACRDEAWYADRAKKMAAAVAKAKHVPLDEYRKCGEMVSIDGGDIISLEELDDRTDEELAHSIIFGCSKKSIRLDADSIIESALEEHHEDAADWLADGATEALQKALDGWRDTYASEVRTFEEDRSVVVVVEAER